MVRVRNYDATENRWIVEPIWPPPSDGASNGPSTDAGDGIRTEAEASGEANAVSRQVVDAPRTVAGAASAGGLVLRTLADHRRFELTACRAACERYVVLDHAALPVRFG